jgi:hypothetical protein
MCRYCGEELQPAANDQVAHWIPYRNPPALFAYYIGIFSLIPCFPLGMIAFVLGIIGLMKARREPEVRGAVHAWVGIVMGFLFGGLWTVATILAVIGAVVSASS